MWICNVKLIIVEFSAAELEPDVHVMWISICQLCHKQYGCQESWLGILDQYLDLTLVTTITTKKTKQTHVPKEAIPRMPLFGAVHTAICLIRLK